MKIVKRFKTGVLVYFMIFMMLFTSAVSGFENDMSFSESNVSLIGDVNGDGSININDAILILRHIVKLIDLKDSNSFAHGAYERAKVGNNEDLTVTDALLVLRYIVGLINSFPNKVIDKIENLYGDYRNVIDFVYDIQILKMNFAETISNGFSEEFVDIESLDEKYINVFFDHLTQMNIDYEDVKESLKNIETSKKNPFSTSSIEKQGLGIISIPLVVAAATFGYWMARSAARSRGRILKVVSNLDHADREIVFNDVKGSLIPWVSNIKEDSATDFWKAVENGDYDNHMAQLHNYLYHNSKPYEKISNDPALKLRPIDAFIEEGTEGVKKGGKLLAAVTSTISPHLGKGIEYAEKAMKYLDYIEKVYEGNPDEALKKYIEDQLKDIVDANLGEGVVDALELMVTVIHDKDPKLDPPGPDPDPEPKIDPDVGLIKIVDSDEEGDPASLAVATKKDDDGNVENEEDPTVVISEITETTDDGDEQLIIPLPEGQWDVDVIDTDGNQDSVSIDAEGGTDTVVQVDTTPLGNFYVTSTVAVKKDEYTEYTVRAYLSGLTAPTTLTISISNAATGGTTQTLNQDGYVQWKVTVLSENGSATIRRNDTGESKTVYLPAGDTKDYSISMWVSPASPAEWQGVTMSARINPTDSGVQIRFTVAGSDGYSKTEVATTNESGVASVYIPGGAAGVRDTITATIVDTGTTRSFNYSFR